MGEDNRVGFMDVFVPIAIIVIAFSLIMFRVNNDAQESVNRLNAIEKRLDALEKPK